MIRTRLGVLLACLLSTAAIALGYTEEKIGTVVAPPVQPQIVPVGKPARLPLVVYNDETEAKGAKPPYILSGWMGNAKYFDMNAKSTENPHSGKTCIKISYTEQTQYGGVGWMDPASDWGEKAGGYNLTGAKSLVFWARGAQGGEKVSFGYGLITDTTKKFHDTSSGKLSDVELTKEWKAYVIPLADKDLRCIKTGFYWQYTANGKTATFFIDDVEYVGVEVVPPPTTAAKAETSKFPFTIYDDYTDKPPYTPTGHIGIIGAALMNQKYTDNPHGGKTCIRAEFTAKTGRGGIIWQDPPNDMGDRPGTHDLKGAGALKFWARGDQGGEKVTFGYGVIGADKNYPDSSTDSLRNVELGTDWKEYTIDLAGKDMSQIKTAFYWQVDGQDKPVVFYIDDITYVAAPKPAPTLPTPATKTPTGTASGNVDIGAVAAPKANPGVKEAKLPLTVYNESGGAYSYDPTGWLGDGKSITLDMKSTENPHAGKTCIRVDFHGTTGNVAGIVWQNPRNNWGSEAGGYNLTGARSLTFWARGANGGEKVTFGYGMIGKEKPYPDSSTAVLRAVTLTKDWQQYSISLVGRDLSCIISGFYWTAVEMDKSITFFLDDIEYSADAK